VATYAQQVAESITKQAFDGLEVILVDDGSTDNSLECFKNYFKGIDVTCIRQENTGPGGARNAGINVSAGRYLLFLDGDDFLLPGAINNINEVLCVEQPDVIFGRYLRWVETKGYLPAKNLSASDFIRPANNANLIEYILTVFPEMSWNSAWRFICKREFILKHEVFFHDTMYCEDMKWVLELLDAVERHNGDIEFLKEPFYGYNYRRYGSIMNGTSPKHVIDLAIIAKEALDRYSHRATVCRELIWQVFYYINEYCTFSKADRIRIFKVYKPLFPLFRLSGRLGYTFVGLFRHKTMFYFLSLCLYAIKSTRRRFLYGNPTQITKEVD